MTEYRIDDIIATTKQVILESLEQEDNSYGLETRLVDDLGAESLDFLDMVFRLEKRFKVKIERGRISGACGSGCRTPTSNRTRR